MSSVLSSAAKPGHTSTYQNASQNDESNTNTTSNGYVVPQAFRDALACHLYMLYTIMIFLESEIKADKSLGTAKRGKGSKSSQDKDGLGAQYVQNSREACVLLQCSRQVMQWPFANSICGREAFRMKISFRFT